MLQDVNPVCDREGGCQEKEDYEFCEGDAEQEEIGKPSPRSFRLREAFAQSPALIVTSRMFARRPKAAEARAYNLD